LLVLHPPLNKFVTLALVVQANNPQVAVVGFLFEVLGPAADESCIVRDTQDLIIKLILARLIFAA